MQATKKRSYFNVLAFQVLAGLFSVLSLIPANAQELELTQAEKAWINEHPVIRVHNEMDWPPFNFNWGDQAMGFSVDYMNLVAARAGLQLEYVSGPSWNEFVEMIRSEELDVIINMAPTPDRQFFIQFTTTYAEAPAVVMTAITAPPIQSMADLRGKKVAVAEGFYHQEFLERNYPDAELVLETDVLGALYAVLEGSADAMFASLPSTQSLMDMQSLTGLQIAHITREAGAASKLALGIRHD
jgi:ABC-type amino acid transport substrate-binding protein